MKSVFKFLVQFAQLLAATYGVLLIVWALAKQTPLAASPLVELFSNLMPLVLLPAPLCVIAALFPGARAPRLLSLAPMLILCAQFAWLALPRAQAGHAGQPLRVASYNLLGRGPGIEEVIGIIEQIDADVIALQEVSETAAAAFDKQLSARYPYRALHPDPGSVIVGQAVLSKYPIVEDDYWRSGLGQMRVLLNVDGRPVALFNVHPSVPFFSDGPIPYDGRRRNATIQDVLDRVSRERGAVVVAGDFNMTPESVTYASISRHLRDAWRAVGSGPGFTWPATWDRPDYPMESSLLLLLRAPIARIDYIWHNDVFAPREMQVWPSGAGSDHRPIVATLNLTTDK
jgi:vancomycin resistance protein VanJ